jgi:nucleotide-binding universal stress UspA family protein
MFRHVFVGVDGRPAGRDAVALAQQLAAPDAPPTLVHIRELAPIAGASHAYNERVEQESAQILEREREATGARGEQISVSAPSVGRGLHSLAERHGADLIVVGSCHRGFAGRVLAGNDTRRALNGASCAVAVAPVGHAKRPVNITMIGVGYDGSPESRLALALARQLAARHHASLRALHVVPIPASPYSGYAGAALPGLLEATVTAATDELSRLGVDGEARIGAVGEELVAFGLTVDLLVIGSRGYGALRRLMLGSTAHYLTGHARCPVVVLPRQASAGTERASSEDREAAIARAAS